MFRSSRKKNVNPPTIPTHPPFAPALLTGALIGLISGMTGTGGGIFLAPIILTMNWVSMRKTAAVTAAYNLLNSAAALVGSYAVIDAIPQALPLWLVAVAIGGAIGAFIGSRYLPEHLLRYLLSIILLASGIKLILT